MKLFRSLASLFLAFALCLPVCAQDPPGRQQDKPIDARRTGFAPASVRFENLAPQNVATWGSLPGNATVTTGVTALDGTTGAASLSITSPPDGYRRLYTTTRTVAVGDWIVAGVWVKGVSLFNGDGSAGTLENFNVATLTLYEATEGYRLDSETTNTRHIAPANGDADTQWTWLTTAFKITSATPDKQAQVRFDLNCTNLRSIAFYAPVLHHIASGTITDAEAEALQQNLFPVPNGATAGTVALLKNQTLSGAVYDSGGSFINPKSHPYGAKGDGATNDSSAIQSAIDASEAGGGAVQLGSGTYLVSGLTMAGRSRLIGSADGSTVLVSTSNVPILDITAGSFEMPAIENIRIRGSVTAGSNQHGIRIDDGTGTGGLRTLIRNVWIEDCGGAGLKIERTFSAIFEMVYVSNCAGYPFDMDSANMPSNLFVSCYAGLLRDSAPAGFRIRAGEAVLKSCNGVNSLNPGSRWAVVGKKNGVDGDTTNSGAILDLQDCNLESWIEGGILAYHASLVNIRGNTTFVGQLLTTQLNGAINNSVTTLTVDSTQYFSTAGTVAIDSEHVTYTGKTATTLTGCTRGAHGTSAASHSDNATVKFLKKPIEIEHINEGTDYFAHTLQRGVIEDSVVFKDGDLSNYVRGAAIHSNGLATFQTVGRGARIVGGDPLQNYWNSVTSTSTKLSRADSYLSKLTITGTTSLTQPGFKYIEVNHSAPTTLTLAWPALYTLGDLVIVKDASSGGAATNNITINANGGGTVNGSSFVMNINGQAVILAPDGSNDWRIVATYSPGGSGITGSGSANRLAVWNGTSSQTSVSGLEYDSGSSVLKSPARFWGANTSASVPTFGFASDTGTGLYLSATGKMGFASSAANGGAGGNVLTLQSNGLLLGGNRITWDASETILDWFGSGSPEGSVAASIGSVYRRSNGSSGTTLYIKESGTGNTGWVAVNPSGGGSGTVNTGAANALAYYPSSGTTVDDASGLSHSPGASPNFTVTAQNSAHVPLLLQLVASQSANALEIKNSGGSTVFNLTPSGGFTAAGDSIFSLTGSSTGSPRKLQLSNVGSGTAFRMELESEGTGFQAREAGKLQIQARYGVKIVGTRNSTFAPSFESGATTDPALYLENGVTGAIPLRVNAISSTSTNLAEFQSSASTVFSLTTAGVLGVVAASDPGSPTNSDLWRSSSRNAISIRNSGQTEDLSGSMWRSSASVFFDTTTTETSIISDTGVGTKTLAADRLKAGSHIRIKASGFYGTKATSPGTFTIKLKNGATTMLTIAAFTLPTNVADQNWWIEATGALNATGSSGTINWTITFHYNDGTGDLKTRTYTVNSTTINTTTTNTLNITGQFSVSDAANFWQTDAASIEIL